MTAIRIETEAGVRSIIFARPAEYNTITPTLRDELATAIDEADADRAGRLRLHVRIDERTAGFLAVGLASGSGRPVPIAMTSGTAVANLGPAVVEANYARVPLIILSANRTYERLGTGANQTMEQLGYLGTEVRAASRPGEPEGGRSDGENAGGRPATA